MFRSQVAPKPWPAAGGARPVTTALGPASSPRSFLDAPAARIVFEVIAHVLLVACSPRAALASLDGTGSTWHLAITPRLSSPWLGRLVAGRGLLLRVASLADLGAVELPSVTLNDSAIVELLAASCDDAATLPLRTLASVAASAETALTITVPHCWTVTVLREDLAAVLRALLATELDTATMVSLRPWGAGDTRELVIEAPGAVALVDDQSHDDAAVAQGQQFILVAPRAEGPVLG